MALLKSDGTLCIENLSEHADHFAPAFRRLPGLGMTLDVGHGEILSQPNAAFDLIARFPDRIRHVHLHDNHGGSGVKDDLHLPVGAGRIDFAGILQKLRAAGYAGGFSFEVKPELARQSRDAIRKIWSAAQAGKGADGSNIERASSPIRPPDGAVRLRPYTVVWRWLFFKERMRLRFRLRRQILHVQHVGSTAVPGMVAKPIIDILIT